MLHPCGRLDDVNEPPQAATSSEARNHCPAECPDGGAANGVGPEVPRLVAANPHQRLASGLPLEKGVGPASQAADNGTYCGADELTPQRSRCSRVVESEMESLDHRSSRRPCRRGWPRWLLQMGDRPGGREVSSGRVRNPRHLGRGGPREHDQQYAPQKFVHSSLRDEKLYCWLTLSRSGNGTM